MKEEAEKARQKRLQLTRAEEQTRGSKFYEFTPCKGTLVNTLQGNETVKQQINYRINKAPVQISSTKLGAQSSVKFLRIIGRKGRYQPQMLTVVALMRMTRKQLIDFIDEKTKKTLTLRDEKTKKILPNIKRKELIKLIAINRYYAFRAK